ncbi:MAG: protein kinase [Myxococcota bacterium]
MKGADRLSELLRWVSHATDVDPSALPVPRFDAASWARELVGLELGDYVIRDVLGLGGMGVVLLADDRALSREVALKVLRPDLRGRVTLLEEARVAARLVHPGIAVVHGVGQSGDLDFVVMERIVGESLRQRTTRAALTPAEALTVLGRIADVLAFAHARGVVHRDLKPENVMLEAQGAVKLLDFGLSVSVAALGSAMAAPAPLPAGTPGYHDPSLEPDDAAQPTADVYAFGVIAFELLRGRLPVPGEVIALPSVAGRARRAELEALVARCLAPQRALRPPDGAALVALLAPALRPRARRWPWAIGVALLVAVLGVGLALAASGPTAVRTERLTSRVADSPIELAALSPDGRAVAWVDASGLSVMDVASRALRSYPLPEERAFRYGHVAWAADGASIDVVSGDMAGSSTYSVSLGDGRVTGRPSAERTAADGYRLALDSTHGVHRAGPPGASDGELAPIDGLAGHMIYQAALSPTGHRVAAIVAPLGATSEARLVLVDLATRATTSLYEGRDLLMDNDQVALAWRSDDELVVGLYETDQRGGNLWAIAARAGAEPRRLTRWEATSFGLLSASADGRRLALVQLAQQTDVWVGRIAGTPVGIDDAQRVTWDDAEERPSAWSLDGRAIFYVANRGGRLEARRLTLDGSRAPGALLDGIATWPVEAPPAAPGATGATEQGPLWGWQWRTDPTRARLVVQAPGAASPTATTPEVVWLASERAGRPGPDDAWVRCPTVGAAPCILARMSPGDGLTFAPLGADGRVGPPLSRRPTAPFAAVTRWDLDADGESLLAVSGALVMRRAVAAEADPPTTLLRESGCWPQYPAAGRGGSPDFVTMTCTVRPVYRMYALGEGGHQLVRASDSRWLAHPVVSPDGKRLAWAERAYQADVVVVDLE